LKCSEHVSICRLRVTRPDHYRMIWMVVARILGALCGLVLVYGALLLDDEQKRLQDRLVEIWVRISELASILGSKTVALLLISLGTVERAIRNLFGPSMVSLQAAGVAIWLSLAAISLVNALSPLYGLHVGLDNALETLRFGHPEIGPVVQSFGSSLPDPR